MNGIGVAIRWLTHPVTAGSTAVLLLNDHVFKVVWPGPVTGKLSDVSGLVVAPALLGLLLAVAVPRLSARTLRGVAVLAVGAGFAWMKLSEAGAQSASQLWSVVNGPSVILRDPTDLMALPGLAVAWFVCGRTWRRGPVGRDTARRVRLAVVLPVVVLAVAATPAPAPPDAVVLVEEVDGRIRITGTFGVAISRSGTGDWEWADTEPDTQNWLRQAQRAQRSRDCVPDDADHCYRVPGDETESSLKVEESLDGGDTWRTAWRIPSERWLYLAYAHRYESRPDPMGYLASVDVMVREVPGGHQVFVANGMEGLAVRDADGAWSRVGVRLPGNDRHGDVDVAPLPLTGPGTATFAEQAATAIAIGLGLWGLTLVAGLARLRSPQRRLLLGLTAPVVLSLIWAVMLPSAGFFDVGWRWVSLALAVTAAVALPLLMNDGDRRLPLLLTGGSLAVGLAYYVPYFGWSLGVPQAYPRYAGLVTAAVVFGLVAVPLFRTVRARPGSADPATGDGPRLSGGPDGDVGGRGDASAGSASV